MSDVPLIVETREDRVVVRLNTPQTRHAIDRRMVAALHDVCSTLEADPRVALITGTEGVFAGGADIRELVHRGRKQALEGINSTLFERIRRLPMPTIALVDGPALGGGAELTYACDFRLGSPTARLGNPEPGLGILAAAGGAWRLAELVGEPLAKEMLFAGRILDAEEALAVRLLNQVHPSAELERAGHDWADRIVAQVPLAVQLSKAVFHAPAAAHPLIDDIAQAVLFETEEKAERMWRFIERRDTRGHS